MGLFRRLLKLFPDVVRQEDFLTEIVAYLFEESPSVLYGWLDYIHLLNTDRYTESRVATQLTFDRLVHHERSSRPDVFVELFEGEQRDMIFIESKVSAAEGPDQLQRYAEILAEVPGIRSRTLIYITRDFDPKDETAILKNVPGSSVRFRQERWHTFYHYLKTLPHNALVDEIRMFMEEIGMAQDNQFTPADVLAFSNLQKVLGLMDATLMGKVKARLEEVTGRKPNATGAVFEEIMKHWNQYLISADAEDITYRIGYSFTGITDAPGYPAVQLKIYINRAKRTRPDIDQAVKGILGRPGWSGYNLNDPKKTPVIQKVRSLRDFLAAEDHVAAIEAYFLELLDELAEIREQYPQLP